MVVVDSSTSAEDINRSLVFFRVFQLSKDGYTDTWPKVREGEWIITMVASDYRSYDFIQKNVKDVLRGKGIIKKAFKVEVKKGEEWKSVAVLGIN